jgi:hypothetical protein
MTPAVSNVASNVYPMPPAGAASGPSLAAPPASPPPPVAVDPAARARLGAELLSRFKQYESDRRLAELKWERSARQYLGVYDNEVERQIDKNRSPIRSSRAGNACRCSRGS